MKYLLLLFALSVNFCYSQETIYCRNEFFILKDFAEQKLTSLILSLDDFESDIHYINGQIKAYQDVKNYIEYILQFPAPLLNDFDMSVIEIQD